MPDNFCIFLFAFLRTKPLLKEVHSERKEFASLGRKFVPFRVDSISERKQKNLTKVTSSENVSVPFHICKILNFDMFEKCSN